MKIVVFCNLSKFLFFKVNYAFEIRYILNSWRKKMLFWVDEIKFDTLVY